VESSTGQVGAAKKDIRLSGLVGVERRSDYPRASGRRSLQLRSRLRCAHVTE
jgi:hypothetical protein